MSGTQTFFTIGSEGRVVGSLNENSGSHKIPGYDHYMPKFSVRISLGNNKGIYSRTAYSALLLLGDVGGFQGAIIVIPAFIMSFYSPRMFEKSLAK